MVENGKQTSSIPDPGLAALVMLLRFQGVGVDPEQIRHHFGARPISVPEAFQVGLECGVMGLPRPLLN